MKSKNVLCKGDLMKVIITQKWNQYLDLFDDYQKDIYFYEEYVRLYENSRDKAFCIVCNEEKNVLLMPYLRRKIEDGYDFETAYGYGGVICNNNNESWIEQAIELMWNKLKEERYICGFIRFHSLLNNVHFCKDCDIIFDRKTVAINTEKDENQMWKEQITSKNRNMIRKAEKNHLEYKAEYDFESLEEFLSLYNATMVRLHADEFYFFDRDYYKKFVQNLKGKAFLGTVRYDGKLICAALFMFSKCYGHYHLEGSDYNYSKLAANNFLIWKTAIEFHKLGVKEFHLGGGYNSEPDNSLFAFKKSFSNFYKEFFIGKKIINQKKYQRLKSQWEINNPEKIAQYGKFLLCYRY